MNGSAEPRESAMLDAEREVRELERRLEEARSRLNGFDGENDAKRPAPSLSHTDPASHFLLLLSDSALPLGAFAFSSGLESYLAHTANKLAPRPLQPFAAFLPESISSFASINLPFALAAYDDPTSLGELDDVQDAMTMCTVGRRASTAQGRALLSVWERSFTGSIAESPASVTLGPFAGDVRRGSAPGHLSPAFGTVCRAVGLEREKTAYVLVMGHVKAVVSAGVRAGVMGPFKAQSVLGSEDVRRMVGAAVAREWETSVEDAGQMVPTMDLWIGRHEVLYSRIFNS